jgi:hypothetical protein
LPEPGEEPTPSTFACFSNGEVTSIKAAPVTTQKVMGYLQDALFGQPNAFDFEVTVRITLKAECFEFGDKGSKRAPGAPRSTCDAMEDAAQKKHCQQMFNTLEGETGRPGNGLLARDTVLRDAASGRVLPDDAASGRERHAQALPTVTPQPSTAQNAHHTNSPDYYHPGHHRQGAEGHDGHHEHEDHHRHHPHSHNGHPDPSKSPLVAKVETSISSARGYPFVITASESTFDATGHLTQADFTFYSKQRPADRVCFGCCN